MSEATTFIGSGPTDKRSRRPSGENRLTRTHARILLWLKRVSEQSPNSESDSGPKAGPNLGLVILGAALCLSGSVQPKPISFRLRRVQDVEGQKAGCI
jgi:hypothetical protein